MKRWIKHVVAAGLAVAVIGAGIATTQPAYADAVKDRRAAMKTISKANKAIKKASKAGDMAAAQTQARIIVATADKLAGLFPRGTDRGALGAKATRAKPAIWSDWDTFKTKLGDLKKVASNVAGGDMAAGKGIGKTCGGCHKLFRGKKAK
jgi:cytochrome c556